MKTKPGGRGENESERTETQREATGTQREVTGSHGKPREATGKRQEATTAAAAANAREGHAGTTRPEHVRSFSRPALGATSSRGHTQLRIARTNENEIQFPGQGSV